MREIKFRGKAINRKNTWFVGDLRHGKNGEVWIFPLDEEPGVDKHMVDPKTVGQFTGLKDKNGKEIYEGDIYSYGDNIAYVVRLQEYQYIDMDGIPHNTIYGWVGAIWRRSDEKRYEKCEQLHSALTEQTIEIIGNLYENPELLEGE